MLRFLPFLSKFYHFCQSFAIFANFLSRFFCHFCNFKYTFRYI
jgi:hypothetical protein